ncbi:LAGLIDADG family homing endonuclease [Halobacillus mangrovi]|uniref:LAGLIDADG family homing endonuclease n=1 Tax=Halobacillus mangrovi TaxID=402384 RepID=UPI001E450C6D|nr:LAGLIDADG family homing endonuclease [Halobacillus mangrovi]
MRKRTLTDEEIIKKYLSGERTVSIAEKANVSVRLINQILSKHKVERSPKGSWRREYKVNEQYFRTWSNNMAYILGFFAADIPKETQSISFSQKDISILEQIKYELGSSHPIRKNEKTGVHLLIINSKIMRTDLMELHGMQPNKSLTLNFPDVPSPFVHHFVRGYFDGGCKQISDRKHTNTKKAVAKRKSLFMERFRSTNNIDEACETVGIQLNNYRRWLKEDQNFRVSVERVGEYPLNTLHIFNFCLVNII